MFTLNAQTLEPKALPVQGAYLQADTFGLTLTVGEPIVGTLSAGSLMLSEGFQRPDLRAFGTLIALQSLTSSTATGGITLITSGGIPLYKYAWSSGDSVSMLNALQPGPYSVTISDAIADTLFAQILLGYKVYWDTLVHLTQDSAGGVSANVSDSLSNGYGIASNILLQDYDGWVQYAIAQGDTFKGNLELTDSSVTAGFANGIQLFVTDTSVNFNIALSGGSDTTGRLGSYTKGQPYHPKITTVNKESKLALVTAGFGNNLTADSTNIYLFEFTENSQLQPVYVAGNLKFLSPDYGYASDDSIYFSYRILDPTTGSEVVSLSPVKYTSDGYYLIDTISSLSSGDNYTLEFLLYSGNRYSFNLIKN
jgi:hypothetical protein